MNLKSLEIISFKPIVAILFATNLVQINRGLNGLTYAHLSFFALFDILF